MIYPNETIRLLREVSDPQLRPFMEGSVVRAIIEEEKGITGVEANFYLDQREVTVTLPNAAFELVISRSMQERTAVLWGIEPSQQLIEKAMHSILDRGFVMRDGLNVVQLQYDAPEHWWKWGDKFNDSTGAMVVTSVAEWDGCIAAFSGYERFDLEFRLAGREPVVLLHEREAAYEKQVRETPPAMKLARILMNLTADIDARYCAFPVATTWLMDEDWKSLLREPYYPDFFLLPQAALAEKTSEPFRSARLSGNRAMLTVLPVKFSPVEDSIERTDRELNIDSLRHCKALGEKYYDQLYECPRLGTTGLYSSAKEAFYDAIMLANELGMKDEAVALEARLAHVKAVFRSQFS